MVGIWTRVAFPKACGQILSALSQVARLPWTALPSNCSFAMQILWITDFPHVALQHRLNFITHPYLGIRWNKCMLHQSAKSDLPSKKKINWKESQLLTIVCFTSAYKPPKEEKIRSSSFQQCSHNSEELKWEMLPYPRLGSQAFA